MKLLLIIQVDSGARCSCVQALGRFGEELMMIVQNLIGLIAAIYSLDELWLILAFLLGLAL
jgi:hypothetical protein